MVLEIRNVRLPHDDILFGKQCVYTIRCEGDKVTEISMQGTATYDIEREDAKGVQSVDGRGGLLLPSLCHSHIHLDKCYILNQSEPLTTGLFSEALRLTSDAKATFGANEDDLYARGDRLIRASVEAGVTSMRAHVEVDRTVRSACIDAGVKLKRAWEGVCDVHIALFMQDPMFDAPEDTRPGENAALLRAAALQYAGAYSAIGSAPYVERTRAQQLANIELVLTLARERGADRSAADIRAHRHTSGSTAGRSACVGEPLRSGTHRGSLSSRPHNWPDLRARIGDLPIYFVGLPQSDLYMIGRGDAHAPRGTINVCALRAAHGFRVAMAVNNVGNAFTPQGAPDPLGLCPLGVAVYQDGTVAGCRDLLEAVSIGSKRAIGLDGATGLVPSVGTAADFVVLHDNHTVQAAALEPCYDRTTIKGGKMVAWRKSSQWMVPRIEKE
ncbi:Metallo-dependent hydrolase [Phellopilus nigrolimitatus]|nr:Metallo-dependent hydrolase [Phellopilus nigrolimitatus]